MSKYNAVKTEVDGFIFASKAEARRYSELALFEKSGEIFSLELQPKFPLVVNGEKIGTYIADFRYETKTGDIVIEDVKGMKTPVYKLKKKLVHALYGVEIVEIG
jgi:hypothetical protein